MTDRIRRFWEKCGWRSIKHKDCYAPLTEYGKAHPEDICHYEYGNTNEAHSELPDINSLDDLFRYAVPVINKKGFDIYLFSDDEYYFAYLVTNDLDHKCCFDSIIGTENPTQALYEALCKALEVEG
jgi:hypothetical protein